MKAIYIDNFRGFKEATIPLCDVNFFVGENSSGKTSILSLLKIISTHEFWMTIDFNSTFSSHEIDLGNFEDMITNSSADEKKKGFSVGYCSITKIDKVEVKEAQKKAFNDKVITPGNYNTNPYVVRVLAASQIETGEKINGS